MGAVGKKEGDPIFKHDTFALKQLMEINPDFCNHLVSGTVRHTLILKNSASFFK